MRNRCNDADHEKQLFHGLREKFVENGELIPASKLLHRAFLNFPKQIALIVRGEHVTYQKLYRVAQLISKKLVACGVNPADRVLLFAENSLEFYAAYFGILQCAAVVVPINTFLHEQELAHVINDADVNIIITTELMRGIIDQLHTQEKISKDLVILSEKDFLWNEPSVEACAELPEPKSTNVDDLCILLYTSGTSGKPKGVMLSSRNIMTNAIQCYARFKAAGQHDRERFFCVLPLFHIFAQTTCIWLPIMTGSSVVVVSKIDRKLISEGLELKPTIFFGFPALYGLLCMMRNAPLDSIKMFVSGADAMPDKIRTAFSLIYGRKICIGYGLTEAAPVVAVNYQNELKPSTVVGAPVVGLDCQIRSDDGDVLPRGQIGNLWMRGDNVMMGYYKSPELTSQVMQNGWLNTGDLGSLDERGLLAITGRSKDLIIHKGFNIYPQEVENILMSHPMVIKAAVIGKEDSLSGQIPVAYVALRAMHDTAEVEAQLRVLCTQNLASYKIPRYFTCLQDLPMSATGKIDKKQLISMFGEGRSINP